MNKEEELRMTYSGALLKDGKKLVRVSFERGQHDYAEGTLPGGDITSSSGFTPEELRQLTLYLQANASDILHKAKDVNFLKQWMKDK